MNASILCVGKLKERWQREGCDEYLKRLQRYGGYELIELPDEPEPAKPSEALERRIVDKEGAEILKRIKDTDFVVALCIDGTALDSVALAERTLDWERQGKRVCFAIGGSLGLSPDVQRRADCRLSFSKMTFPHGLARVVLLEQLYRAARINAGERYHK